MGTEEASLGEPPPSLLEFRQIPDEEEGDQFNSVLLDSLCLVSKDPHIPENSHRDEPGLMGSSTDWE